MTFRQEVKLAFKKRICHMDQPAGRVQHGFTNRKRNSSLKEKFTEFFSGIHFQAVEFGCKNSLEFKKF